MGTDFSKHPLFHIFSTCENHTHSYISVEHIFRYNVINGINAGGKFTTH